MSAAEELERLITLAIASGATCVPTSDGGRVLVLPPALAPSPSIDAAEGLVPLSAAATLAATTIGVLRRAIRRGDLQAFGGQRDRAVRRSDLRAWIEGRRARPVAGEDSDVIAEKVSQLVRRRSKRAAGDSR